MKPIRISILLLAGVFLLAAVVPLAAAVTGEVPAPSAPRSVATDLWVEGLPGPAVSIPLAPGMVALASWVKPDPVKIDGKLVYPFAEIRMFAGNPGAEPTKDGATFKEVSAFAAGAFKLAFTLPNAKTTIWFLDSAKGGTWHSVYELADHKGAFGFSVRILSSSETQLVLEVDEWPAGDPTAGWGPR